MIWGLEGGAPLFGAMMGRSHTTEVVIPRWCGLCIVSWKEAVCPSHLRISGDPRLPEGGRVFDLQKASLLLEGGLEQPLPCESIELKSRPNSRNDYLSSSGKLFGPPVLCFRRVPFPFLSLVLKQPVSQGPQLTSFFNLFTGCHHVQPISRKQAH